VKFSVHILKEFLKDNKTSWLSFLQFILNTKNWSPKGKLVIVKADKEREVTKFSGLDLVVSRGLNQKLKSIHSHFLPCVHSYIEKKDQMTALRSVQSYLRSYRKRIEKNERNLFVYRCDIKKCGESIFVGEDSKLWKRFLEFGVSKEELSFIKKGLRPALKKDDVDFSFYYGTPTGSPLQPLALNTYLSLIDQEIYSNKGKGFYARFGDDIVLIHEDLNEFQRLVTKLEATVRELKLDINMDKREVYQFNGAPRKVVETLPFKSHLEFLGMSLSFVGGIAPNQKKTQNFMKDFRRVCRKLGIIHTEKRYFAAQSILDTFFSHPLMITVERKVDDRIWDKDIRKKIKQSLGRLLGKKSKDIKLPLMRSRK